jgi:LysR family cyn operon transcriptional activator
MKLAHLRTFVAIADSGGFARAAAQLGMTQSAVSRQIDALESELGVLLFDRVGRRVQLTSEGEDLLARSRRLLGDADALGERARVLKGGQTGTLRVSATPQVIESLLAPFLTRFLHHHPGVEVRFVEAGATRQQGQLARGEVHLAIMAAGGEPMRSRLLYPIHVVAVLPGDHRLRRLAVLDITELADEQLLLPNYEFGARAWFDGACNVAGISPRVLLESRAPHTLTALAAVGYGIAVLPSNVPISQSAVRIVPLLHRGVPVGRWSVIAWNPQRFLAPYAEQFVKEFVAHVRRAHPGRDLTRRAPKLPQPKSSPNSDAPP